VYFLVFAHSMAAAAHPFVQAHGVYPSWVFQHKMRYRIPLANGSTVDASFLRSEGGISHFYNVDMPGHPRVNEILLDHRKPLDQPMTLRYFDEDARHEVEIPLSAPPKSFHNMKLEEMRKSFAHSYVFHRQFDRSRAVQGATRLPDDAHGEVQSFTAPPQGQMLPFGGKSKKRRTKRRRSTRRRVF
jgi:hypothetical protein